jgi:hypothetical protein
VIGKAATKKGGPALIDRGGAHNLPESVRRAGECE